MKFRVRIVIILSGLTLLFSLAMVAERAVVFRRTLLDRTQDRTDYLSSFIIEISGGYLETGNVSRLKDLLGAFDHFKNIAYLRVVDRRGRVVYRMAEPGLTLTDRQPDPDVFHARDDIFDVSRDIVSNGTPLGYVQLGISVKGLDEAVADLVWRGVLISVLFTWLIALAAWAFSRRLGQELAWLLSLAESVEAEKLPEPLDKPMGGDTGTIARTLRDLHARLRQEEARRLEAEAQKNDFFEMTVHDLKQPATALKAALDLLLSEEEARSFTPEQLASLRQIARTSLAMLNTMIADVLNTSRLNDPASVIQKERVPLGGFLRECAAENSASVTAAGKRWSLDLPDGADGAWMFADRDILRRVVGNLVLNAIQYTPEGGAIRLGAELRDGRAAIYVSDDGAGIPENFRQEIFKKFSTMGKSPRNLGLGLAFCKLAADRHSAVIEVRSEVGKGTEISFVIPVSIEQSKDAQRRG